MPCAPSSNGRLGLGLVARLSNLGRRCLTSLCHLRQDQLLTEDEVIAALPPWTSQITVRALCVGGILGAVFSFITMRFSLGPGGVVPTFNMPIGAPAALLAL